MKSNCSTKPRRTSQKYEEGDCLEKRQNNQNPSRRHREKLNTVLDELTGLLPLQDDVKKKLDKLSVLKLTVSFFQTQNLVKGKRKPAIEGISNEGATVKKSRNDINISELALEAIGGFFIVLTEDGNVFYISENVNSYLGYSQTHMMHQEFLSYIHPDEVGSFKECLSRSLPENVTNHGSFQRQSSRNEGLKQTSFCNVRCHAGRLSSHVSPFYYKCFKFFGCVKPLTKGVNGQDQYGFFALCTPVTKTVSVLKSIKESVKGYTCKLDSSFSNMRLDNRGVKNLHLTEKDIHGLSAYFFFHPDDLDAMKLAHEKILGCGEAPSAFRCLDGKGRHQWVRGRGTAILGPTGKLEGLITENILCSEEEGQYYKDLYMRELGDWKRRSLTCSETSSNSDESDTNGLSSNSKSPLRELAPLAICLNKEGNLIISSKRARKIPGEPQSVHLPVIKELHSTSTAPTCVSSVPTTTSSLQRKNGTVASGRQQCAANYQPIPNQDVKPQIALTNPQNWSSSSSKMESIFSAPSENLRNSLSSFPHGNMPGTLVQERQNMESQSLHSSCSSDVDMPQQDCVQRTSCSSSCAQQFGYDDSVFEDWNSMQAAPQVPMEYPNGFDGYLPSSSSLEHMIIGLKNVMPMKEHNTSPLGHSLPTTMHDINTGNTLSNGNINIDNTRTYYMDSPITGNTNYPSDFSSHCFDAGSLAELESIKLDELKSLMSVADSFAPKGDDRGCLFDPMNPSSVHQNRELQNSANVQAPFYMQTPTPPQNISHQMQDFLQMQVRGSLIGNGSMLHEGGGLRHDVMAPTPYSNLGHYAPSLAHQPVTTNTEAYLGTHPFPGHFVPNQFDMAGMYEPKAAHHLSKP